MERYQPSELRLMLIYAARDLIAIGDPADPEGPKIEALLHRIDEICRQRHNGTPALEYFKAEDNSYLKNRLHHERRRAFLEAFQSRPKPHGYMKEGWFTVIGKTLLDPHTPSPDERLHQLLRTLSAKIGTSNAKELAGHLQHQGIPYEVFGDGYLSLEPKSGNFRFLESEVSTEFNPPGLERTPAHRADYRVQRNRDELDPAVGAAILDYIAANPPSHPPSKDDPIRGGPTLRTAVQRVSVVPSDAIQVGLGGAGTRLVITMGSSDWIAIQAYNNRLYEERRFRAHAMQTMLTLAGSNDEPSRQLSWFAATLPPFQNGATPSFCASHVVMLTGSSRYGIPEYLTLTLRPSDVRYYQRHWSIGVEENFMGPMLRPVEEHHHQPPDQQTPRYQWERGDISLHQTARRGIAEELGLHTDYGPGVWPEITPMVLLSLQVEADFGSVVGVFETHAESFWPEDVVSRMRTDAKDFHAEVQVLAFEPATLANLVSLIMSDRFSLTDAHQIGPDDTPIAHRRPARRFYTQDASFDAKTQEFPWHPTSRGRLLRYILANSHRYPVDNVLSEFERHGLRVS